MCIYVQHSFLHAYIHTYIHTWAHIHIHTLMPTWSASANIAGMFGRVLPVCRTEGGLGGESTTVVSAYAHTMRQNTFEFTQNVWGRTMGGMFEEETYIYTYIYKKDTYMYFFFLYMYVYIFPSQICIYIVPSRILYTCICMRVYMYIYIFREIYIYTCIYIFFPLEYCSWKDTYTHTTHTHTTNTHTHNTHTHTFLPAEVARLNPFGSVTPLPDPLDRGSNVYQYVCVYMCICIYICIYIYIYIYIYI